MNDIVKVCQKALKPFDDLYFEWLNKEDDSIFNVEDSIFQAIAVHPILQEFGNTTIKENSGIAIKHWSLFVTVTLKIWTLSLENGYDEDFAEEQEQRVIEILEALSEYYAILKDF